MIYINSNKNVKSILVHKMIFTLLLPFSIVFLIFISLITAYSVNFEKKSIKHENFLEFKKLEAEVFSIEKAVKTFKVLYPQNSKVARDEINTLLDYEIQYNEYIKNYGFNRDFFGSVNGVLTYKINNQLIIYFKISPDTIIDIYNSNGDKIAGRTMTPNGYKNYEFKSEKLNWTVIVYSDKRPGLWHWFLLTFVVVVAVGIFFSSFFIARVTGTLKEPFSMLLNITREIGAGNYNVHIPSIRLTEFYHVAESFGIMAQQIENRENELHKYREELEEMVEQRTDELKDTQQKLAESEKMASLGTMVIGISHELNTPIGIMLTGLSYISDELNKVSEQLSYKSLTSKKLGEFIKSTGETVDLIEANSMKISSIVKNFKMVAVDQESDDIRHFNIVEYATVIIENNKQNYNISGIEVELVSDDEIYVDTFPGAFYKVLNNLIQNSYEFGFKNRDKGTISISIKKIDTEIQLIYKDDGIGMNQQVMDQIFEPFFTTNRGAGNTGLGMFIVYNQVTQTLKGSITSYTQENSGCEYYILFPEKLT